MMQQPRVSIIVPSRSGRLGRLAEDLKTQTFQDYEIVINTEPPTPGHARNQGAQEAKGRVFIFFDDDVSLSHPRLLENLVEQIEQAPPLSVVGIIDALAADANPFQEMVYRLSVQPQIVRSKGPVTQVPWCDSINGRCMGMTRETFDALGGFDGKLIAGEDFEILYRLTRLGGRVYALSQGTVSYYPPPNAKVLIRKTIWYSYGNAQVARKYPESGFHVPLKSVWSTAGYLLMRTAALLPLCFCQISFKYRKPKFKFRPLEALVSYLGALTYCLAWYKAPLVSNPESLRGTAVLPKMAEEAVVS